MPRNKPVAVGLYSFPPLSTSWYRCLYFRQVARIIEAQLKTHQRLKEKNRGSGLAPTHFHSNKDSYSASHRRHERGIDLYNNVVNTFSGWLNYPGIFFLGLPRPDRGYLTS